MERELEMVAKVRVRDVVVSPSEPRFVANVATLESATEALRQGADIIELRLDYCKNTDPSYVRNEVKKIRDQITVPLIATLRKAEDGGNWYRFCGTEEDRFQIFQSIMDLVDAVDIEVNSEIRDRVLREARKNNVVAIVSYHDYFGTETIENIRSKIDDIYETSGAIVKVAYFARKEENTRNLMQVLLEYVNNGFNKPIVAISMGAKWFSQMSRYIFPCIGSCMTYGFASIEEKPKVGQIELQELVQKVNEIRSSFALPLRFNSKNDIHYFKRLVAKI